MYTFTCLPICEFNSNMFFMLLCGCICACMSCLKPYCSSFPFKIPQYQLPLTMVSTDITLVQVFFVLCAFQPEHCFTPLGFVRESFMSILCLQFPFMHPLSFYRFVSVPIVCNFASLSKASWMIMFRISSCHVYL